MIGLLQHADSGRAGRRRELRRPNPRRACSRAHASMCAGGLPRTDLESFEQKSVPCLYAGGRDSRLCDRSVRKRQEKEEEERQVHRTGVGKHARGGHYGGENTPGAATEVTDSSHVHIARVMGEQKDESERARCEGRTADQPS